jgi:hypothetical protein
MKELKDQLVVQGLVLNILATRLERPPSLFRVGWDAARAEPAAEIVVARKSLAKPKSPKAPARLRRADATRWTGSSMGMSWSRHFLSHRRRDIFISVVP